MLLKLTGDAILKNDFEAFAMCFHLPHFIATAERHFTIETQEQFREMFDTVHHDYMRRQITDLVRICDVAEYRTPTRIEATHTTHMMSGNQRVVDPFPSYSVLELIDGRWQATSTQYAVDKQVAVGRALNTQHK